MNEKEISSLIKAIKNVDTENLSIEEITKTVGLLIDGYWTNRFSIILNGFYRARKNKDDIPFSHIQDLWYPPAEKIKDLGRLNSLVAR